ncbi:aminotransferase class I/II-fold pyridoxal phosphate-dependent enzyme [Paenibacillus sp. CCS19]|uniref:trans-sulfuration enzyme family protein n=1 Tax=Paenibacillus sp. CCS19 TaxID=3158387 RepID=UPI00295E38E2|nr:aminotransferase class I/II-fold pyridoxal phosphate-dependent enzyme [Paenibacillus cellulosilyticus]
MIRLSTRYQGLNTRLIHTGEKPDPATGSAVPPIYQTTTFAFPSNESMLDLMEGRSTGHIYTRFSNPNFAIAEAKIAQLEAAEAALLLASGMAAISTAILTLAGNGDHIISHADIYGGSFGLLHSLLPNFGIATSFVDAADIDAVKKAIRPNTKLILLESPSNPTLQIYDIRQVANLAHEHDVQLIVDNTFSVLNQKPLELGADVVVHSCTKYINGHSDVMAGAIVGTQAFIKNCSDVYRKLGGNLNGFDAWLLIRGMKTLGLRVQRHNENALLVAEYLQQHPRIETVHYPGLPSHPQHKLAADQMTGFGGVLSVELQGGQLEVDQFLNRLELFTRAVSLGSVESLITQPVTAVHHSVPESYRALGGIKPNLIRLSIGIEEVADIIADLEQALS